MAGSCVGDSSRSFGLGGHAGSSGVGQITVVYMDAKINNIHIFSTGLRLIVCSLKQKN